MFNVFQIVVITLFTALMTWHKYNLQILYYAQVVGIGAFCGCERCLLGLHEPK